MTSEAASTRNDQCMRCNRTGFELFKISYYNGYGTDGDNTIEMEVCRDCRQQCNSEVERVLKIKKTYKWWQVDSDGWPIVWVTNRPVFSAIRVLTQNLRKVTG